MKIAMFYKDEYNARHNRTTKSDTPNKAGVLVMVLSSLLISICTLMFYAYWLHFGLVLLCGYFDNINNPTFGHVFGFLLSLKMLQSAINNTVIYTVNLNDSA